MQYLGKLLFTAIVAASAALPGAAQAGAENIIFDLRESSTFSQCTQTSIVYDHSDINPWNFSNYYSAPYMSNYNITSPFYADYLVSPALSLEAGVLYAVHTSPAAYNYGTTTELDVLIGTDSDYESYDLLEALTNIPYNTSADDSEAHVIKFTVPTTGSYHLAFLGKTYPIYLFATYVTNDGPATAPKAVSDLSLSSGADGVAITFTMPAATMANADLTGETLSYTVSRDGTSILTGSAAAGAAVSLSDATVTDGMTYTYSVTTSHGDDTSDAATASIFVGTDTPTAVTDLALTFHSNTATVSWSAPATGIHGNTLAPEELTYVVTRILDDTSTQVATLTGTTTFSETITPEGLQTLSYSVTAALGGNVSAAATTSEMTIGSVALPFADSFAGGTIGGVWSTEVVNGTYNWAGAASASSPTAQPVDSDGGLAYYKSYSAQKTHSARLITAPISKASSINPVVEYYLCHYASSSYNDIVKIQVSIDGGEWIDVPGGSNSVEKTGFSTGQWEKCSVSIAESIPQDCDTYRVSFTAVSDYGWNVVIDAVRIFNLMNNDLAVTSLTGPDAVISGNNAVFTLSIANNGANAVSADDYTISVESTYPGDAISVEPVAIEALSSADVTITLPVTAIEALSESFTLQATINYAPDEDLANNASELKTVAMTFSSLNPATELTRGADTAEGDVTLTWTPANDPSYQPLAICESFEDFEDGATGPFNGFTVLDLDGKAGETYYSASGSALKVSTPSSNKPAGADGSKVLGVTCAGNTQQNDWLISPELTCPEGSTMEMSMLIGFKSSSAITNKFEIVYATGDYDAANPEAAFTHTIKQFEGGAYSTVKADETLHEVKVSDIPAEAKYLAVHINTKTSASYYNTALWIDKVTIAEEIGNPLLGYNVYDAAAGKVNAELIAPTETSYVVAAADEARDMFVTAVYDEGEAVPTNTLHIDAKPTAPEYDLAVKAVSVAPQLVAGVETSCSVTIANEGLNDVSADEYQVVLSAIADKYVVAAVESADISAGSDVTLTFVLKADFAAAQQQLSGALTATVVFDNDLVPDNNSAQSDTFAAAFAAHDPVSTPEVDIDFEAHCPVLIWGSAESSDETPLLGYNVYDADSGKVNTELLSDTGLNLSIDDNGHEFFVTAMYSDGETAPSETVKIELDDKSVWLMGIDGADVIYSGNTAQFVVTVCNSGISAATSGSDFVLTTYAADASEVRELAIEPLSMANVTIDVAIDAMDVLFADDILVGAIIDDVNGDNLGGINKDALIKFVDKAAATDLTAAEDYAAHVATLTWTAAAADDVLGYNVYDKATGLLTSTPLSAETTAFEVATTESDRSYFVTAVYAEGEAEPSNNATVASVTDLRDADGSIVVCDNGVIVKGYAGMAVQVYDVAGRMVASTICHSDATLITLAKGTYLVQVADTVSKVAL